MVGGGWVVGEGGVKKTCLPGDSVQYWHLEISKFCLTLMYIKPKCVSIY